jgi:hypothetical protein
MRKRDSILLENCYNKVQNPLLKEAVEDMEFSMQIDVDYLESDQLDRKTLQDLDVQGKVTLRYRIDIEYRSWGIKDIYPVGMKLEPFTLTKMDEEFEEKPVKNYGMVDLSSAEHEGGLEKNSFSPSSIVLFLDKDLNIVPEKCKVIF